MSIMPPITIRVFVTDPGNPTDVAKTAITRTQAAAKRLGDSVAVAVLSLASDEAIIAGAAIEPTVAVEDLVISTGQAPAAGHIIRAAKAIWGEMG
jgi:hypothetical protein